jgi:HSP90 family molecular chaperone
VAGRARLNFIAGPSHLPPLTPPSPPPPLALRARASPPPPAVYRSLDEYVNAMPEDQKQIYYIAGESLESVQKSPFLERVTQKGLEVLFLTEPIDEYVIQNLPEFGGKRLQSISKEGLQLPAETPKEKRLEEAYKESFKPLTAFLKKVYGDKVEKVAVSPRLATTPCVLVTSQFGYSANMERILKSQAFADPTRAAVMHAKKIFEINPRHPIIAELLARLGKDAEDASGDIADVARVLYDVSLLNSGFSLEEPGEYSARIFKILNSGLGGKSLELLPEMTRPELPEEPEAAAEGEAAAAAGGDDEEL